MSKIMQITSRSIRQLAVEYERVIDATPEDKQTWKPFDEGRSMMDLLLECTATNTIMAQTLNDRAMPQLDPTIYERLAAENETTDQKLEAFHASIENVANAMEAFPPDQLDEVVALPMRGGMEKTFAELAMMVYSHLSYHSGQINYIQTLYGDKKRH